MPIQDLLTSGFSFSQSERFFENQYKLLNSVLLVAILAHIPLIPTLLLSTTIPYMIWQAIISSLFVVVGIVLFLYIRRSKENYELSYKILLFALIIDLTAGLNFVIIHSDRAVWFGVIIMIAYFLGGKSIGIKTFIASLFILSFHALFIDLGLNVETMVDSILMVIVLAALAALYERKYRTDVILLESSNNNLEGQLERQDAQIIKHIYEDKTTKLPNKEAYIRDILAIERPKIAILSLRSFRSLNNIYGSNMLNKLLIELVKFIQETVDGELFKFYRIGSNDWAVIGHEKVSENTFIQVISKVLYEINDHTFTFENPHLEIDIEMVGGICFEQESILEKANAAMQDAKEQHNNFLVYTTDLLLIKTQRENIALTQEIKYAVANDDIEVHYQAIVDKDQNIIKYESLVRMRLNDQIMTPSYFLEFSKKTRYYSEITKIVIDKSFTYFKNSPYAFSVNLSFEDITNESVVNYIKDKLAIFPKPEHVIFEIVESEAFYNHPMVDQFISDIKELDAKIAIDDFGTGYSNFSHLINLDTDILKIDGSLIKDIDTDESTLKVVKSVISFARSMDVKIVAEYIHNKEVFDVCKEIGVDEFQGFYFATPQAVIH